MFFSRRKHEKTFVPRLIFLLDSYCGIRDCQYLPQIRYVKMCETTSKTLGMDQKNKEDAISFKQ